MADVKYTIALSFLQDMLEKHPEFEKCSKDFHTLINGDEDEIKEAVAECAPESEEQIPFACFWDGECFLFTLEGVYARTSNIEYEKKFYRYKDITTISRTGILKNNIKINDEAEVTLGETTDVIENTKAVMEYIVENLKDPSFATKTLSDLMNPEEKKLILDSLVDRIDNVRAVAVQYR